MSELQAALARRRSLNGEATASESPKAIPKDPVPVLPPKLDTTSQMLEQEKSFMMKMEHQEAEDALKQKVEGAFLLRPKDDNSFVVSVRKSDEVIHFVVNRVSGLYSCKDVKEEPKKTIHECLGDLRSTFKLPKFVFISQADSIPVKPEAVSDPVRARGTLDELDELDDFLKDEELIKELNTNTEEDSDEKTRNNSDGWRMNKDDHLFGHTSDGDLFGKSADLMETALFTEAAEQDDLTSAMQLKDLQIENRKLRQQVNELMFHLRKRDEDLAVSSAKIAQLTALLPSVPSAKGAAPGDVSRAKDLLKSKLGEFGFSAFNVETALDDINQSKPIENMDITVNEVLDRLTSEGAVDGSSILGLSQQMNQSSFLGNKNSGRKATGPKASQFGLFGEEEEPSAASTTQVGGASPTGQSSSPSEDSLFKGMAAVDANRNSDIKLGSSNEDEGKMLSYNDFIARLMRPESSDLVLHMKLFISSILGPNGDATPPPKQQVLEYRFYGTYMLQERCADFFEDMEKRMARHVSWQDIGDAGVISARNNIEKFVMSKIADFAMASSRHEEQDLEVSRRMTVLSFVTPEALEVNPNLRNDVVWTIAQDELRKMAQFKAPGDKIACVVKCCQVIFSVLNLQRGSDDTSRPGADDFLPIFIYVVLKSNVPNLYSNCEYIQNYHNPAALMSKAGYCFVNLRSAIEFVLTLDGSVINMDEELFNSKLAEAEAAWNATHQGN